MGTENTSEDWGADWLRHMENKDFINELCIEIINNPEKTLQFVLRHCKKDSRILEAGCGVGPWVHILDKLGYDIVGLDYSKEAIDIARNFNPKLKFEQGDVNHLQHKDESFDVVLSWGVLEHFSEGLVKSLTEKNRVLGKGGYLILGMPPRNLLRFLLQPLFKVKEKLKFNKYIRRLANLNDREKSLSLYYYSAKELISFLEATGFSVTSITHTDHKYGLREIEELLSIKPNQPPFLFYSKNESSGNYALNKVGKVITNFFKNLNKGFLNYNLIISAKKVNFVSYDKAPKFNKSFFNRNSRY
tara:strand:+ start:199 stop:1104 length:906 start_codon:yes stop_codon:yes gene_type:complete